MQRLAAAILLLLAAAAEPGPAGDSDDLAFQCSTTCEGRSGKFSYLEGHTYSYEYRTDSVTAVSGSGDDQHQQEEEARLHVSATADVTVLSPCEFSLQVRDATLEESAPGDAPRGTPASRQRDFSAGVSAHALRFSLQEGRVAHMCASRHDAPWAVNFKRGLLSAFQNSMADLRRQQTLLETDVAGVCDTQYHVVSDEGSTIVVKRQKNLRACSNRVQHFLSLPSASYSAPAKSLPLIRSEQSCEQTVEDGQLTRTSCEETHMFRPFSNGGNGATTRVSQLLVLSDVTPHHGPEPTVELPARASLLFHHPAPAATTEDAGLEGVQEALRQLGGADGDGVRPDAPGVFSRLVRSLRALDRAGLSQAFLLARRSGTRKYLLDAMPLVSTADSMVLMVELLSSRDIAQEEGDSWLQSLTYQTRPTADMLQALLPLLEGQPRPAAMLGVSSLVHGYCAATQDCQDAPPVRHALSRLEGLLGHDCRTSTRQEEDLVLHALKAVGNAGVLAGSPDLLARCFQTNNSVEVRLAAISAHRRLACDETTTSRLLYTYGDTGEDTEVRVAAYLAAMRCPSEQVLRRVKETLYSEDVSQVASFVWTHLTNLQETASPGKLGVKELLASDLLRNKFSTDVRKSSRNYEASMFSEALNLGGTVESSVVFSPESYLPRSATFNLTVDLFGEAVNLLELGGRAEGFEDMAEDIFAPGGLFPEKSLRDLLLKLRGDSKKTQDEMSNSIDKGPNMRLPKPPTASLYTRIFGNELKYSHFNGLEDIVESLGKLTDPKELLSKFLRDKLIDYSKSLVLVDASYVIPTLAGFPLEFTVNGSATVGLKAAGHVDVGGMWSRGDVDIKGHVIPSLAVEFSAMMSVDAFAARAGILSVSRLHSNTLVDGKLKVRGRKLVEMKVNVPRDKMEVLEVSSRLLLVRGDKADQKLQQIKGVQKDKEEKQWCTPNSVSTLTGMKVCTELVYSNATRVPTAPYFPLTGPFIFRTWLEKTDSFNSYDLSYHSINSPYETAYQFSADTPGSKIDRRLKFLYFLNTREMAAKLNVIVPGFKLEASGQLDNSPRSKGFDGLVLLNDNKLVQVAGLVKITETDQLRRYQPSLSLIVMNRKLLDVTGRMRIVDGTKYTADLVAEGITSAPILISGDVTLDVDGVGAEATLNSSVLHGSLHADLRRTDDSLGAKAGLSYILPGSAQQAVSFSFKAVSTEDDAYRARSALVSLRWSSAPQYDVEASYSWQADPSGAELSANLQCRDLDWQVRYMDNSQRQPDRRDMVKALYLKCPELGLDTNMELYFQSGRKGASCQGQVSGRHHGYLAVAADYLDNSSAGTSDLQLRLSAEGALRFNVSAGLQRQLHRAHLWLDLASAGRANLTYTSDRLHSLTAVVSPGRGREYSGSLEWLLKPESKLVVLEVQLDKRFSFTSEVREAADERAVEAAASWGADGDASRAASLLLSWGVEKAQASLLVGERYASAEINYVKDGAEASLQWTGGREVRGRVLARGGHLEVSFSTPFPGLQAQSAVLDYQRRGDQLHLTGEVLWQEKNVNFSVETICNSSSTDNTHIEIDAQFASPFVYLRNAAARFSYIYSSDEETSMKSELSVDFNGQNSKFTTDWYITESKTECNLSLQSPWDYLEVVLAKLKLENSDILSSASVNLQWNSDVSATIDFSCDSALRFYAALKARQPMTGYGELSAEMSFAADDSLFVLGTQATMLPFEATLDINRQSSLSFRMNGWLSTPALGKWEVDVVSEGGSDGKISKVFEVKKDGNSISRFDVHGKVLSLYQDTELYLTSMFFQNVVSGLFIAHKDSSYSNITIQASWNGEKLESSINGEFAEDAGKLSSKYDAMFYSTFLKRRWMMTLLSESEPGKQAIFLQFPENISVNCHFISETPLNCEIMAQLNSLRLNSSITQRVVYSPRKKLLADFVAECNENRLKADYNFSTGAGKQNVVSNFITPWTNPIHLELSLEHTNSALKPSFIMEYGGGNEVNLGCNVVLEKRQGMAQFHFVSPFTAPLFLNISYSMHESKALATFQWDGLRVEASIEILMIGNTSSYKIRVLTPFESWENVTLVSTFDGDESGTKITLSMGRNLDILTLSGLARLLPNDFRVFLKLKTPFIKFRSLSIDCTHDNNNFSVVYEHNGKAAELTGKYQLDSRSKWSTEVKLKSSSKLVEDLGLRLWCDLEQISAGIIAHKDSKVVQALINSDERRTEIQVTSPFKIVEESYVSVRHDYVPSQNLRVNMVLAYNKITIHAAGYVSKPNNDSVTASLEVRTPFTDFEKLRVDCSVSGLLEAQKTASVTVSKNDKRFDVAVNFNLFDNQQADIKLKIDTPFEGYESVIGGITYTISNIQEENNSISIGGKLETYYEVAASKESIIVSFVGVNTTASANITTSFKGFESASLATSVESEDGKFFANLHATWNEYFISGNLLSVLGLFRSDTQLHITTTLPDFEDIVFSIGHDIMEKEKTAYTYIQLNGKNSTEVNISGLAESESGYLNVAALTPINFIKTIYVSSTYRIPPGLNRELHLTLNSDSQSWEIHVANNESQTTIQMQTPVERFQSVGVTCRHHFHLPAHVSFTLEKGQSETLFDMSLHVTHSDVELKIISPFKPLKQFELVSDLQKISGQEPGYLLSLNVLLNSQNIVAASTRIILDWTKKIGISITKQTPQTKEFTISVWGTPKFPPSAIQIIATKERTILGSFEGLLEDVRDGGFTLRVKSYTRNVTRDMLLQYYPKDILIKFTSDMGVIFNKAIQFQAELNYDEKEQSLNALSKIATDGDEKEFILSCSYGKHKVFAELKTPINSFEKLTFEGFFNLENLSSKALNISVYKNNQVMNVDMFYSLNTDYSKILISAQMPFFTPKELGFNIEYNFRDRKKIAAFELQFGTQVFTTSGSMSLGYLSGEVDIKIVTPLEDFQHITVESKYDFSTTAEKEFSLTCTIGEITFVEMLIGLDRTASKGLLLFNINCFGEVSITGNYDVTNDLESYVVGSSVVVSSQILLNFSAQLSKDITHGKVITNVFDKESEVQWEYLNTPSTKELSTQLIFDKNITHCFSAMLKMHESSEVEASVCMDFPYSQRYMAQTRWNIFHSENPTGSILIKLPEQQHVMFESILAVGSVDDPVVFTFIGNSSLKELGQLNYETKVTIISESFILESKLDINRQNVFSVNLQGMYSHLASYVTCTSKSSFNSALYARLGYDFLREKKTISGEFEFGTLKVLTLSSVSFMSGVNLEANLEITAPNTNLPKLHFHCKFNLAKSQRDAEILLEIGEQLWKSSFVQRSQQSLSLVINTPVLNFEDFKLSVSVSTSTQEPANLELIIGKYLTVTAMCLKSQKAFRFGAHGQLSGYEPAGFEGMLTRGDVFHCMTTLTFDKKEIVINLYVDFMKRKNTVSFESSFKCPWMEDTSIVGHFKTDGEKESQITLTRGTNVSNVKGNLKYFVTQVGYSVAFTILLDDLATMLTAEIETGENLSLNLISKMDSHNFNLNFVINNENIVGHMYLNIPHTFVKDVDGSVEMFFGTIEEPQSHFILALKLEDKSYNLSTNVFYSVDNVSGNFTLLTPDLKLEKNMFVITCNDKVLAFECQVEDMKIATKVAYIMSWPVYSLNLTLDLLYYKINDAGLSFFLDAQNRSLLISSEMQSNEIFSLFMKVIPEDFTLRLRTHLQVIPDISITSKFEKNVMMIHTLYSTVKWKAERIVLETASQIHPKNFATHFLVTWNDVKKLDISASYIATGSNHTETIETSLLLSTPNNEFSSKLEVDLRTPNTIIAHFDASTPFNTIPDLIVVTNIQRSAESLRGYVSLTSNKKTLSVRIDSKNSNLDVIDMNIEVYIPIDDVPPVELTVRVQQRQWKDFKAFVQVHCFNTEGHANMSYLLRGSKLDGVILVGTPSFTKEFLFGGSLRQADFDEVYIEGYIDSNKVTLIFTTNYNEEKSLKCHLQLPIFDLNDYILTAKVSYGPSKLISVIYKTDDHAGNATFALKVTSRNISLEAHLNFPVLCSSRHLARMSIEYAQHKHFVQLYYEHGDFTDVATLLFSNDKDLRLSGYIQSNLVGEKEITLEMGNNFKQLVIDIWKSFQLTIKRDTMSGSIDLNTFGEKQFISYKINVNDNFEGNFYVESPYIKNKKFSISATSDRQHESSITQIHIQSGDQNCKIVTQHVYTESTNDVSATLELNSVSIITSGIKLESTEEQFLVNASLKVFETVHKGYIRHSNMLLMYDSEFRVSSPYLPEEMISGLFNVLNGSVVAYIGYGSTKFIPILAVESAVDCNEGSAFINIESQTLKIFQVLSIHGVLKVSDWRNIMIHFEGQFLSEMFPTVKGSGTLSLNKQFLDASLSAESSLLGSDQFGCSILIPLSLSFDLNPKVMVLLPSGLKYGLNLFIRFLSEKMEIGLNIMFRTDIVELKFVTVYGSQGKLHFEVNMPLPQLSHFRIDLMGYRTLTDGTDTSNFIEWNENRVELKHAMLLETNKAVFHLGLLTPFENHSHYDVNLHYENRQSKVASILFTLPMLGEKIGINLDLMFSDLLDFNFLGEVNLPLADSFDNMALSIGNNIRGLEINSSIAARYNNDELGALLTSSFNGRNVKFNANSHVNEDKLSLGFEIGQENHGKIQAMLELVTPFKVIRKFSFNAMTARNPVNGVMLNVAYNYCQVFYMALSKDINSSRSLVVHTPWRKLSGLLFYKFDGQFMVEGELCWDVEEKNDSIIGLNVFLKPLPENRLEASARLKIPSRTVRVDAIYQANPNRFESFKKLSWKEGYSMGYHLLFNMQDTVDSQNSVFLLRGDMPFQSFEINANNEFNSVSGSHVLAEALWDALSDRTKKMQVSIGTTTQQTQVSFHHPCLRSNLVLRIMNNERFRIELEYSPLKENMFVLETYVGFSSTSVKSNTRSVDAMFLIQHNASRLNLHLGLEALIAAKEVSGALDVQYRDFSRGDEHVLNLGGVMNYEVPMAEVNVRTTDNTMSAAVSTFRSVDGSHGARLRTRVDKKVPLSLEVKVNTVHPLLELEVHCGDDRSYSTYMGLPNRRQIVLGASHVLDGARTVDGLLMVALNSSRLLWTTAQWHYDSRDELLAFLRQEYEDLPAIAGSAAQRFSHLLQEDFAGRFAGLYAPVQQLYTDLGIYAAREVDDIHADARQTLEELAAMYERNDFYLMSLATLFTDSISLLRANVPLIDDLLRAADCLWRTVIVEPCLQAVKGLSSAFAAIQAVLEKVKSVAAPLLQRTFQLAKDVWRPREVLRGTLEASREILLQAERVLSEALSNLEAGVTRAFAEYTRLTQPYILLLEEVSSYVGDHLELFYRQLQEVMDWSMDAVLGERELEQLAELYERYASWLEELHLQGQLDSLQDLAFNYSQTAVSAVEEVLAACQLRLTSALSHAVTSVSALTDLPEVAYVSDLSAFILHKVQWAWQYYEVSGQLKAGLHNAVSNMDVLLADLVSALGDGDSEDGSWQAGSLLVRPGLLEFSLQLPFDWHGFDEMPHLHQLAQRPLSRSQRLVAEPAVPGLRSSSALLVAGRHFITFDGRFFDFVGNYSYVLAADLDDYQFSVFITYLSQEGSRVKKTLTVVMDEQRIELGDDGQVLVSGDRTNLPAAVGTSALLWRRGDSVIVDALRHGLRLRCDLRLDACSLQVGDRHRGKVSGLLGSFEGDLADHTCRWRLLLDDDTGDRCEQSASEEKPAYSRDPLLTDNCDGLFDTPGSPLRPCYSVVDPAPFRAMCLRDDEGPCASANVYWAQCRAAGVQVHLPPECVRCALQDGSSLEVGEARLLDPDRPEAADVVLVVERAPCLAQLSLRDLGEKLYAGMALRGLEDVRYAVISFGPGQPPESHTAHGRLWASHRSIRRTLQLLTFSNSTGGHGSNAVEALQYASQLGFREGASRTVVLVQCSPCRGDQGYGELVSRLLAQRATLHILEPDTVRLAHNNNKTSKVYGLDMRGAYTGRNVRTLQPSYTLRRQVKLPKDQCTPAALETGGTLFNLAHLLPDLRDSYHLTAAKKFLDVWARRVTATTLPARCQTCECRLGPDGVGQTFCDDCPSQAPNSMLQILQSQQ